MLNFKYVYRVVQLDFIQLNKHDRRAERSGEKKETPANICDALAK